MLVFNMHLTNDSHWKLQERKSWQKQNKYAAKEKIFLNRKSEYPCTLAKVVSSNMIHISQFQFTVRVLFCLNDENRSDN